MSIPATSTDNVLRIYLALADYPILRSRIRSQMRRLVFDQGMISPKVFEAEVREKALRSQEREGIVDPLCDENGETWALRMDRVRRTLTDSYFAHKFPYETFEEIVRGILAERMQPSEKVLISFNPELAPQEMLFEQAQAIEQLPPDEFCHLEHRYDELIVVLIRRIISDQLAYINVAKGWFATEDLINIQKRKIGFGRIGGKSAGMLLAYSILNKTADESIRSSLKTPDSYFIGADVMYDFMSFNELIHWSDQKYKNQDQIRADYPLILEEYSNSNFPPDILQKYQSLLDEVGNQPLIVRSSSLLEDNFGMSFAGKYESVFCPNQGTPESNLHDLTQAIARVYASVLN
ncbi:MAG: PEP/pyruvate-binding domain-containing protein, partial [Anaerolineales bacterium]|nr:PEP/pyruvate-binding domain-containing protein [Anaerolineales bacterium]